MIILILVCLISFLFQNKKLPAKQKWFIAAGLLYISVSWGLMVNLRNWGHFDYGREFWNKALPLGLVLSIWINDTMAYLVGSLTGKTPFSKISPKKTWEGTLGGIILCIIVISLVFYYWWDIFSLKDWMAISFLAAITGTFGDLLESKLKRMAGVKDSGSIMPGHGGFLDRFDSMLLATPAVWIYVQLFSW
jgi:phosphatidate cytidylyltransferase